MKDSVIPWAVGRLGGVGLVGSDVCAEQDMRGIIGKKVAPIEGLRYALAGKAETEDRLKAKLQNGLKPVIGTSYPVVTRALFRDQVIIKYIPGSTEALPELLPEVDGIVDLVKSGNTLRENNLKIFIDDLARVNLMLIRVNESATIIERNQIYEPQYPTL